jgi:hypothetical protein
MQKRRVSVRSVVRRYHQQGEVSPAQQRGIRIQGLVVGLGHTRLQAGGEAIVNHVRHDHLGD